VRRTLIALATGFALAATMALPAGAAVATAHPGGGGGHGGGYSHGDRGDGSRGHELHGDGDHRDGHHRYDHDGRYDGPYYDPYYDGYDGSCPDGGHYDASGTYWYWDPGSDAYEACPDG
jgi:hypothetical protein